MTHPSTRQIWLAYGMGIMSGVLCALIYREMRPESAGQELQQYVDVSRFVDQTFVRELEDQDLVTRSLKGLLSSLDPYSRYYDPQEAQREEQETAGQYLGIGVVLRWIDGQQRVLFPVPGSPADRAGLRTGDEVLAVAGQSTQDLPWSELSQRLRGQAGTSVRLELRGLDGLERSVDVERGLVPDPSVRHAQILEETPNLGYLTIRSFSRRTGVEFDLAMEELEAQGLQGLIIDLRGNRGGVMEAALHIADRFVDEGLLLRTESRVTREEHFAKSETTRWPDLPVVFLVDGLTASASEILASALQDHQRASLVGTPTYGKGMVQTIRSFGRYGTKAKVTSAYYYSPKGRLLERTAEEGRDYGILPDVAVPLPDEVAARSLVYAESYGVPDESRAALDRWQAQVSTALLPSLPRDDQVLVALDLLQGKDPAVRFEAELDTQDASVSQCAGSQE